MGVETLFLGSRTIAISKPVVVEAHAETGAEVSTDTGDEVHVELPSLEASPLSTIQKVAQEEGIDWKLLQAICYIESRCDSSRIGDNGNSYGAFQIYLSAHPTITKAQAQDFEWAARWTAKHGKKYADNPALFFKAHNGIAKTTNQWYVDSAMDKYNELAKI